MYILFLASELFLFAFSFEPYLITRKYSFVNFYGMNSNESKKEEDLYLSRWYVYFIDIRCSM